MISVTQAAVRRLAENGYLGRHIANHLTSAVTAVTLAISTAISGCGQSDRHQESHIYDSVSKSNLNVFLDAEMLLAGLQTANQQSTQNPTILLDAPLYVRVPKSLLSPSFRAGFDFEQDHIAGQTHAFGWLRAHGESARSTARFIEQLPWQQRTNIEFLDEQLVATHAIDPDTMREIEQPHATETKKLTPENDGIIEGYHDYEALTAELETLTAANRDLTQLETAGTSVSNRNLWYMKVGSRLDRDDGGPRTLLIANMHGDETAGRELMIYLLRELLGGYGKDDRITRIVNGSQVFVMPSMNPDGFEVRRRHNTNYKDLNRSFPDFTDDPRDTTTGRPAETVSVMNLHDRYEFANSLNFHGGTVCFNMPWDTRPNRPANEKFGDDSYMTELARAYASTNRTMLNNHRGSFNNGVTYGYEWYEVDGGMQDWSIYYREATHATVELSYAKTVSEGSLRTVWNENRESILNFLDRSTKGVHLRIVNDRTGELISAPVMVATSNAPRTLRFRRGIVHRMTPDGSWKVTVEAEGFAPQELTLTATHFDGNFQTVRLRPTAH